MKNKCIECGGQPKYVYETWRRVGRMVFLKCRSCGMISFAAKSDPAALLYWNQENPK